MKYKIILLSGLITVTFLSFSFKKIKKEDTIVDIKDAVANAQIQCEIKGNASSTHYNQPLIAKLKNTRNKVLAIRIPAGFQFEAQEPAFQNMLVTKTEIIKLNPNQTRNIEISAMCTEANDAGPTAQTIYVPGKKADGTLLKLAEFIDSKKYNNAEAQNAVWVLTNNRFVEDIVGFDTSCARNLQRFICKETNRKMPPPPAVNDYSRNYYSSNLKVTVGGMFEFMFPKPTNVTIAMFNKNNVVVRELFYNPAVAPGKHKINYEFDASVYTEDVYYFKLIADGRVLLTRKLEMDN